MPYYLENFPNTTKYHFFYLLDIADQSKLDFIILKLRFVVK